MVTWVVEPIGLRESAVRRNTLEETGCVKAFQEDLEPTTSELMMLGSIRLDQDDDPAASDSSIRLERQEKLRGLISSPGTIPAKGSTSNPTCLRLQYASMSRCACVIITVGDFDYHA